jgi:hypothetical protein
VKCLRWTADAKHLSFDKDAGRPGVFRQQIADGYFCIQLHFAPIISKLSGTVFAPAQTTELFFTII